MMGARLAPRGEFRHYGLRGSALLFVKSAAMI
jgi:hypothetical protein